jgi:hypothetical protein
MFNVKLYTTFNLFLVIFSFQNFKTNHYFLILDFQHMNSCDFKEIIVTKDLEIKNGVLGLERDVYLSVVKILDSLIVRKV